MTSSPPTSPLPFQQGLALHRQGRLAEAKAIYESILGKQPFPSAADIGYLGEIPTIVAGLLLMPNLPSRAAGRLCSAASSAAASAAGG